MQVFQHSQQPRNPPVDGPTDQHFRMGGAVAIGAGLLAIILVIALDYLNTKGMIVFVTAPFAVFLGLAAVIDPNIGRALGKYGLHLPVRSKLIAGAFAGAALICSLGLSALVYFSQSR
jgi:hypothetical protein